jgi:hypothetical protein
LKKELLVVLCFVFWFWFLSFCFLSLFVLGSFGYRPQHGSLPTISAIKGLIDCHHQNDAYSFWYK